MQVRDLGVNKKESEAKSGELRSKEGSTLVGIDFILSGEDKILKPVAAALSLVAEPPAIGLKDGRVRQASLKHSKVGFRASNHRLGVRRNIPHTAIGYGIPGADH
ncbi:hypothetical protein B296_00004532 [Ensete ventricosum]|uniref:Uncharacterized protein n=1 Tax=Ensete ventricosum TaxID=4639 RepID=A0A426YRZ6_ENSVE|nr:hypothetical protein B296_00004532 [Ensete ventricosum]